MKFMKKKNPPGQIVMESSDAHTQITSLTDPSGFTDVTDITPLPTFFKARRRRQQDYVMQGNSRSANIAYSSYNDSITRDSNDGDDDDYTNADDYTNVASLYSHEEEEDNTIGTIQYEEEEDDTLLYQGIDGIADDYDDLVGCACSYNDSMIKKCSVPTLSDIYTGFINFWILRSKGYDDDNDTHAMSDQHSESTARRDSGRFLL